MAQVPRWKAKPPSPELVAAMSLTGRPASSRSGLFGSRFEEDTAQDQAEISGPRQRTAAACEERGQALRPLRAAPTGATRGWRRLCGGCSLRAMLTSHRGHIWCREEATLRNTYLGPILGVGRGPQVRTGKSEGGRAQETGSP